MIGTLNLVTGNLELGNGQYQISPLSEEWTLPPCFAMIESTPSTAVYETTKQQVIAGRAYTVQVHFANGKLTTMRLTDCKRNELQRDKRAKKKYEAAVKDGMGLAPGSEQEYDWGTVTENQGEITLSCK